MVESFHTGIEAFVTATETPLKTIAGTTPVIGVHPYMDGHPKLPPVMVISVLDASVAACVGLITLISGFLQVAM
jgi:hypothetical protein